MDFTDLDIKREYRSLSRDVVHDFYTPVLAQSVLYRRAVGFFSSSALISLTEGIKGLLLHNGKIGIIASPKLSQDDINAIEDAFASFRPRCFCALWKKMYIPAVWKTLQLQLTTPSFQ